MRKSITLLQSSSLMRPKDEHITVDDVLTVSVRVPRKIVETKIIEACRSNSFQDIHDSCQFIISEGYPVSLVLQEILNFMINGSNNSIGEQDEKDNSNSNSNDDIEIDSKSNSNSNSNNASPSKNKKNKKEELFTNLQQAKIALKIGKADKKLVDGASEFLQLLDVMACIGQNIKKV